MQKIGIVTFHRAINYGAVLQTVALYKVLEKNKQNQVYVIDYNNEFIDNQYRPFPKGFYKSPITLITALMQCKVRIKKKHKFEQFLKRNVKLTESISCKDAVEKEDIGTIVTGSDQVWNYRATEFDEEYFLKNIPAGIKKVSYAASFGFDRLPDEYTNRYRDLLSSFNSISVREASGLRIVRNLLGDDRAIELNIDPTLLLTKQEWSNLIKTSKKLNKKFILLYTVEPPIGLLNRARILSKVTGFEIIYINSSKKSRIENRDITFLTECGPEDFLLLFQNAEYVFTNSFHGTVFSIIFHKPFCCETENKVGFNTRVMELLDMLGLEKNSISVSTNSDIWDVVDNVLEKQREKAWYYLKSIGDIEIT